MPSKSRVQWKMKEFMNLSKFDYKDVVVTGHSAVFALAGVAEDHSDEVVVATTASNYAKLAGMGYKEINGYNGAYLSVDGVLVRAGLPLDTETHHRIKCVTLDTLKVMLRKDNQQAHEILDTWQRELLAKKLRVKPELRRNYLSLDEQLFFQDILEHRSRVLTEEEKFVLRLDNIDWSHRESDDGGVWRSGEQHRQSLREEAAELFGEHTTIYKQFETITHWGYRGYSQLREMYPWINGYKAGQREPEYGVIAAALISVTDEYMQELREIVVALDKQFRRLPSDIFDICYVWTPATPSLYQMRTTAETTGYKRYYGISVNDATRKDLLEVLLPVPHHKLKDIHTFRLLSKYADSLNGMDLRPDEIFSNLHCLHLTGYQREFLFLLEL